jgi:hypothetical protein
VEGARPVPLTAPNVIGGVANGIENAVGKFDVTSIDFNNQTVKLGAGGMLLLLLFLLSFCCRGKRSNKSAGGAAQPYKQLNIQDRGSFDVPDEEEDMINPFAMDDD